MGGVNDAADSMQAGAAMLLIPWHIGTHAMHTGKQNIMDQSICQQPGFQSMHHMQGLHTCHWLLGHCWLASSAQPQSSSGHLHLLRHSTPFGGSLLAATGASIFQVMKYHNPFNQRGRRHVPKQGAPAWSCPRSRVHPAAMSGRICCTSSLLPVSSPAVAAACPASAACSCSA